MKSRQETKRIRGLIDAFKALRAECEEGADFFDAGVKTGKALARLGKPAAMGLTAVADPQWVSTAVIFAAGECGAEFDQEVDELHRMLFGLPFEAMLGLTEGARASGLRTELIDVPDGDPNVKAVKAVRTVRFGPLAE